MTLDEAIKHCLDTAGICTIKECADDHRQVANWLKDYKRLLTKESGDLRCRTCLHFKEDSQECRKCYEYSRWEGDSE